MLVSMQPHVPSKVKAYRMEHLTILLAFLMTIGTQVSAADPAHLQQLKNTFEDKYKDRWYKIDPCSSKRRGQIVQEERTKSTFRIDANTLPKMYKLL